MLNRRLTKIKAEYDAATERYFDPYHYRTEADVIALDDAWRRLGAFLRLLARLADMTRTSARQCVASLEFVWCIWATKCMVKEPWKQCSILPLSWGG